MSYLFAGLAGLFAAFLIVAALEIRERIDKRRAKAAADRKKAIEDAERRGYFRAISNCKGAFVSDLIETIRQNPATEVQIVVYPHDEHAAFQFRRTVRMPDRIVQHGRHGYQIGAPAPSYEIQRGDVRTFGAQVHVDPQAMRYMEGQYASQHVHSEVQRALAMIDAETEKFKRGEPITAQ